MSELNGKASELDTIQGIKDSFDVWVHSQENFVAELLKSPAKFRQEAALIEMASINDLRGKIIEKQKVLDELESRLEMLGLPPDHQQKIALDTLDDHVSSR